METQKHTASTQTLPPTYDDAVRNASPAVESPVLARQTWWRKKRFIIALVALLCLIIFGVVFGAVYGTKRASSK